MTTQYTGATAVTTVAQSGMTPVSNVTVFLPVDFPLLDNQLLVDLGLPDIGLQEIETGLSEMLPEILPEIGLPREDQE